MLTMEYRKKNNIRRHDFIDLLMEIRDHPEQVGEEDVVLTAQAFVFFLTGFESPSTTISNVMYELALNPNTQEKLRKEVKAAFDDNKGKLNYNAVKEVQYLDKVFRDIPFFLQFIKEFDGSIYDHELSEIHRKYPALGVLAREAMCDHTFAESNITITKGTKVFIPVYAIHHDLNIYPDPEKFDPERFEKEAVESRPDMTYLPFDDGPRIYFGERFAYSQTKLGLATIIRHFKLEVCEKTCKQYERRTETNFIAPKGGLYLRIKKL